MWFDGINALAIRNYRSHIIFFCISPYSGLLASLCKGYIFWHWFVNLEYILLSWNRPFLTALKAVAKESYYLWSTRRIRVCILVVVRIRSTSRSSLGFNVFSCKAAIYQSRAFNFINVQQFSSVKLLLDSLSLKLTLLIIYKNIYSSLLLVSFKEFV